MKTVNAKTLRAVLFTAYLLLALLFTAAAAGTGLYFQNRNQQYLKNDAGFHGLFLDAAEACRFARLSMEQFALKKDKDSAAHVQRQIFLLRDAAEDMAGNLYGRDLEYRQEVREFSRAVNQAVLSLHALKEENFAEVFRSCSSDLQEAEEAIDRINELRYEENLRFANAVKNDFWFLEAMLFFFFLLSLLFTTCGFALVGRNMRLSLKSLSEGTREFRNGKLDYRFQNITPDEIGQIKYDFNIMASRLSAQAATLKNANTELKAQAESLIAAHQHKDRFLSNMSHELRTPLSSIIGFSELLESRGGKLAPEKVAGYGKRILTAAEHLLELITSLLDLAKSGAGVLKPVFTEFDMASAIRETAGILSPLAAKKNLEVIQNLPETLMVKADQRMVKQIFINLFSNAVKFTQKGTVTIGLKQEDADAVLTVTDTGIGIPEEEQSQLFTDFHRVDNGPEFVTDGVGIGLALSRRLAELHHGSLTFRSTHGEGSAFTFRFPCE